MGSMRSLSNQRSRRGVSGTIGDGRSMSWQMPRHCGECGECGEHCGERAMTEATGEAARIWTMREARIARKKAAREESLAAMNEQMEQMGRLGRAAMVIVVIMVATVGTVVVGPLTGAIRYQNGCLRNKHDCGE